MTNQKKKKRLKVRGNASKDNTNKPLPRGLTANGKRIFEMMRDENVKGNWKDWVLFVGPQMIERYGTYTINFRKKKGDDPIQSEITALVHKSKLSNIIGGEFGKLFWDSKRKCRTNYGAPPAQRKKDEPNGS